MCVCFQTLKWNFTAPRAEFVDQLRTQMEGSFGKGLMEQLFHADFKQHIKAIETLGKVRDDNSRGFKLYIVL